MGDFLSPVPLVAASDFSPTSLIAVVCLILLNGFFVAAEFALVSVRRTRIQELVADGSRRAVLVKHALDDINQFVSTAQVGITMCSLGIGFLGEPAIAAMLEEPLSSLGIEGAGLHAVSLIIAFSVLTYFHVVIGEVAPKNFALQKAEAISLAAMPLLTVLRKVFTPAIWLLNGSADILFRLFKVEPAPGMHLIHSEEELKMLVSQSSKGGVLEDSEQEMLYNVFDFADTDV
ncbi:MAG: hypothetical protein JWM90_273, partial [Thermoleophilia bacterium]|nr:hypothetical protein [Thermoleophilia bacterium]